MNLTSTRRTFALRFGSVLSALGLTAAAIPSRDFGAEFHSGCERRPQAEWGRQAWQRKRRHHAGDRSQRLDLCLWSRRT